MSQSVLERDEDWRSPSGGARNGSGIAVRRRSPIWLLLFFTLVGLSISVAVSMLAGSSPFGVLIVAGVIVAAVPVLILMIQAAPEAVANARVLARTWTWWHPLWFFIFFSMLVFRIRDVGEAKANPLDAYAMIRILPEAFVFITLIIRLDSEKAKLAGCAVSGDSGRDGDLLPGVPGYNGVVGERFVDRL